MLPTDTDEQKTLTTIIPSYLYLSMNQKLVAAYVLGTMHIFYITISLIEQSYAGFSMMDFCAFATRTRLLIGQFSIFAQ